MMIWIKLMLLVSVPLLLGQQVFQSQMNTLGYLGRAVLTNKKTELIWVDQDQDFFELEPYLHY